MASYDKPLEVKIDAEQISKLREFFNATTKELNAASNRAIKKTIRFVKTQVLKDVSAESNIQQKVFKTRAYTSFDNSKKMGRFWFGTYRVSLARLNPKQIKNGVRAGIRGAIFVQSAFLIPIQKLNGEPAIVPYQVMKRRGKNRLPIDKQLANYRTNAENIDKNILPQIPLVLMKRLKEELNWETQKR